MKTDVISRIVQGQAVLDWVREATADSLGGGATAIGWLGKDGELAAGVAFDFYTGHNAVLHQRVVNPPPRGYWAAVADYVFRDLDCDRITGLIEECDAEAVKLTKHIGFTEECRMKGAARDGGDIIIFVLWKKDARMLNWRKP
jgi:RimJ/RimL family protein N-acetyltransferase